MSESPTVFIVDDDAAALKSLARLVASEGYQVAPFESAEAFRESYDPNSPGCLVLDVRLGRTNGIEFYAELVAKGISIPSIVISGYANVPSVVAAMRAGAVDFLEKPINDTVLMRRVREAVAMSHKLAKARKAREEFRARMASLSPRQREVMDMLVVGMTTKEIAGRLGISTKTIDCHRSIVLEKLKAEDVVQLVRLSLQHSDGP